MKFNESFPSLITPDAKSGLVLASELAEELQAQIVHAGSELQSPGGTSYTEPPLVPKEIISSILFYSIAAANHGWSRPEGVEAELESTGADRLGPGSRTVS